MTSCIYRGDGSGGLGVLYIHAFFLEDLVRFASPPPPFFFVGGIGKLGKDAKSIASSVSPEVRAHFLSRVSLAVAVAWSTRLVRKGGMLGWAKLDACLLGVERRKRGEASRGGYVVSSWCEDFTKESYARINRLVSLELLVQYAPVFEDPCLASIMSLCTFFKREYR